MNKDMETGQTITSAADERTKLAFCSAMRTPCNAHPNAVLLLSLPPISISAPVINRQEVTPVGTGYVCTIKWVNVDPMMMSKKTNCRNKLEGNQAGSQGRQQARG